MESAIHAFRCKIQKGSTHVYTVCHRALFPDQVKGVNAGVAVAATLRMMWIYRSTFCFVLGWLLVSLAHLQVDALFQYSVAELLKLRRLVDVLQPLPGCSIPSDIYFQPNRRYIHRGPRGKRFYKNSYSSIPTWLTTRRRSRNAGRGANHCSLASLPKVANSACKSSSSTVNFGLLNIRSLNNKGPLVRDVIMDYNLDFLCLTETWQQSNDFIPLNASAPPGFVYNCQPRASGRGGGLALFHRESWKVLPIPDSPLFSSFEYSASLLPGPSPTVVVTVYRPPKYNKDFMNDFSQLFTHLSTLSHNLIILGDFNIHMDNISSPLARDFASCLESLDLHLYTDSPTHCGGHMLDLVCCSGIIPSVCKTHSVAFSDHMLITFNITLPLSKLIVPRTISFRNIKDINTGTFASDINNFPSVPASCSPDELVSHYNTNLHALLDTHAPLRFRSVSFTRSAPWFTPALRLLKSQGRQLERLANRTGLTIHKNMYMEHVNLYKNSLSSAKSAYYSHLIHSNHHSSKTLFSLLTSITKPPDSLPYHMQSQDFCNNLMFFFVSKITDIHNHLTSSGAAASGYNLNTPYLY
ncbi:hypothetical protein F2P79_025983, partial [Pimephales promelas]